LGLKVTTKKECKRDLGHGEIKFTKPSLLPERNYFPATKFNNEETGLTPDNFTLSFLLKSNFLDKKFITYTVIKKL